MAKERLVWKAKGQVNLSEINMCTNLAFAFSATETPSSVQILSVNERRTVPEHALMTEPGQTSGAAAV